MPTPIWARTVIIPIITVNAQSPLEKYKTSNAGSIAVRNDLKDLVLLFILSSGFLSSSFSGVFWYGFGFVLSRVYR